MANKQRELPRGFEAIREAIVKSKVNGHTDMSVEAMRADVATLTTAVVRSEGDVTLPPKNRGRFTGLRTYDFQNTLFYANDLDGWRFTDRTLALVWAVELSANRCDFIAHHAYVGSTRSAYVNGRHGSNVVAPEVSGSSVHALTPPKPEPKAKRVRAPKTVEIPETVTEPTAEVAAITE